MSSVPDPAVTEWVPLWGPALEVYEQAAEPIPAGTGAIWIDTDEPAPGTPVVAYGTTLPASPVDGQEAILVDSITNPSYQWRFRYNAGSTSAYKWEFVGGPPLSAIRTASETYSAASVWVGFAAGPNIVVPRNGDYLVTTTARVTVGTSTPSGFHLGVCNASLAPDALVPYNSVFFTAANQYATVHSVTPCPALGAGQTLRVTGYGGSGAAVDMKTLTLTPVRVA